MKAPVLPEVDASWEVEDVAEGRGGAGYLLVMGGISDKRKKVKKNKVVAAVMIIFVMGLMPTLGLLQPQPLATASTNVGVCSIGV